MGSNSHLWIKKPTKDTIVGQIARRMTPHHLRPKTSEEIKRENQRRRELARFDTHDERSWLNQEDKDGS